MTELQCQKCNYKFESTKKHVEICPYCGSKGTVHEVPSACDILSDVTAEEKRPQFPRREN